MILLCFGTRPEWLKIKPLLSHLKNFKLLFTGQHEDLLSEVKADYRINIQYGVNRLDDIISSCLLQFPNDGYDSVLIQGDTASAMACAVAAFNRNKKIYYLEAGLRSFNLNHPYPEEAYRQIIARISDINFCPTQFSKKNLEQEKVNGVCHVVGNTSLDNLIEYKSKCEYTNIVLVTLHRRENHLIIEDWFKAINKIASENKNFNFILPIHPNPNIQKYKDLLKDINVVNPLPHNDLINIICKCKFIITDSGGIQEEASFLNKKAIVCRETTERPEGLDTGHLFLCKNPNSLKDYFDFLTTNYEIDTASPYGDGQSSIKIAKIINNENL
jgi:UDP-N-acetylglucosamine 2-epimerase (non-hydrolysing)